MNAIVRPGTWIIGHRGASGYRPEHTRAAYELAIKQGADALEPDLVPTKDGVLVLRHENEISVTTDVAGRREFAHLRTTKNVDGVERDGWFTEDFEWDQLKTLRAKERIPQLRPANTAFDGQFPLLRFSDLLDLMEQHNQGRDPSAQIGLVAEIKHPTYFGARGFDMSRLISDELHKRPWGGKKGYPLVLESFERTVLLQLQDEGVDGEYVFLLERNGQAADDVARDGDEARSFRSYLRRRELVELAKRFDGISPDRRLLIPNRRGMPGKPTKVTQKAKDAGLKVYTWTLRAESYFIPKMLRADSPEKIGNWRPFFDKVFNLGLDGVFVDHPDLARKSLSGVASRL